MEGLLEGIKVIDMGHVVAVPAAGRTLSDWGADVIKVEPLSGEYVRGTSGRSRLSMTSRDSAAWSMAFCSKASTVARI